MEHLGVLDKYVDNIRNDFIQELEERYTKPGSNDEISVDDINKVRAGEKIKLTRDKRELIIRIAQDYRLSPDETDSLIPLFFYKD